SHTMPMIAVNDPAVTVPAVDAYSAPPRPATKELTAKITSFARTMLIPVVDDAVSLERIEANTRPVVARLGFTTRSASTPNTSATTRYIHVRSDSVIRNVDSPVNCKPKGLANVRPRPPL